MDDYNDATMAEMQDMAATLGLDQDRLDMGWNYAPVNSNTNIRKLRSGALRVELKFELPPEDVEVFLRVSRDPGREPTTIGKLIDDVVEARVAHEH